MRVLRSKKMLVTLGATAVAAAALAATALSGIWAQSIQADAVGGIHYRVVSTSAFDYDSGWHMHPGPAIVQVRSGSFQIYQGSCTPKTVNTGETYIETPYVPVRAVAVGRIEWTTTLIGRQEEALLTPVASPCP
jgi:hypothetical protein